VAVAFHAAAGQVEVEGFQVVELGKVKEAKRWKRTAPTSGAAKSRTLCKQS